MSYRGPGPSRVGALRVSGSGSCPLPSLPQGIADTAQTIYETAAREHESRGVTGAVGEVLRQIPPAVVRPLIVATEATSNVLGGMRNQIRPDVRQDESQKWRRGED